jgi:hypothetical protein
VRDFALPFPETLDSAGLEILGSKGSTLLSGDIAKVQLKYKLWLPSGHFGLSTSRYQQVRRRIITLPKKVCSCNTITMGNEEHGGNSCVPLQCILLVGMDVASQE